MLAAAVVVVVERRSMRGALFQNDGSVAGYGFFRGRAWLKGIRSRPLRDGARESGGG